MWVGISRNQHKYGGTNPHETENFKFIVQVDNVVVFVGSI